MAIPSDSCLLAFGRIVYWYAQVEFGIKATIAGILDIHIQDAQVLTEPYNALALRNVAKSIAKSADLADRHLNEFVHIVGGFQAASLLRNTVAHSRWTEGTRPGSIRPTRMEIRNGRAQPMGWDASEPDYTADDFNEAAKKLILLNARLLELHSQSCIRERIEAKIAAANSSIEAADGNSNSPS